MEAQVQRLENAIAAHGGFTSPFVDCQERMESFFADVFYELSSSKTDEARRVFIELVRMYNRVLASTTNWVAANTRLASLGRLLRAEIAGGQPVTLITFNQDLVAENAVYRLPRRHGARCLSCIYGRPPIEKMGSPSPLFPWTPQCDHTFPVQLFKLHGSLNWFTRTRDEFPSAGALFPSANKEVFALLDGQIRLEGFQKSRNQSGRTVWHLWPLVIPPIYDKHRLTGTPVIGHQWLGATQAIVHADRLVAWGYSLPDADVTSAQMLRRAIRDNGGLDSIHVINPDHHLVGRVKDKLGVPVVHQYDSAEHYLKHRVDA